MAKTTASAGKKGRKHGRTKRDLASQRYTSSMRWISNKLKKLERHVRHNPNDEYAAKQLKTIKAGGVGESPQFIKNRIAKLRVYVKNVTWDVGAKKELELLLKHK